LSVLKVMRYTEATTSQSRDRRRAVSRCRCGACIAGL